MRPHTNTLVPLINDYISAAQSIEIGMFKDPCLMGVFPLLAPDLSIVALVNMISMDGSYGPRRVPSPLSSSLPVPQVPIPFPFSSPGEPIVTSNHKI